jgi:hypothetical protein
MINILCIIKKIKSNVVYLLIIYIIYKIYIKINNSYWVSQPVFHYYHLHYWLNPPGILNKIMDKKFSFYNEKIKSYDACLLSIKQKKDILNLTINNYCTHLNELYKPSLEGIMNYFIQYTDCKNYISLYYLNNKLIGVGSIRPLNLIINKDNIKYIGLVYLGDNFCIDKKHRGNNYAIEILHTHSYNIFKKIKQYIGICKREGKPFFSLVHLTKYYNYCFNISTLNEHFLYNKYYVNVIIISKNTIHLLLKVWNRLIKNKNFECIILPKVELLISLINNKEIYVAVSIIKNEPYNIIFFKKTHTTYKGYKSLECTCCFNETHNNIFIYTFLNSLHIIKKRNNINILFIGNIGNNKSIIKYLLKKNYSELIPKIYNYFYLWNFAIHPIQGEKVFIID